MKLWRAGAVCRLSLSEYEKAVKLWRKEKIEEKAHGCQTI